MRRALQRKERKNTKQVDTKRSGSPKKFLGSGRSRLKKKGLIDRHKTDRSNHGVTEAANMSPSVASGTGGAQSTGFLLSSLDSSDPAGKAKRVGAITKTAGGWRTGITGVRDVASKEVSKRASKRVPARPARKVRRSRRSMSVMAASNPRRGWEGEEDVEPASPFYNVKNDMAVFADEPLAGTEMQGWGGQEDTAVFADEPLPGTEMQGWGGQEDREGGADPFAEMEMREMQGGNERNSEVDSEIRESGTAGQGDDSILMEAERNSEVDSEIRESGGAGQGDDSILMEAERNSEVDSEATQKEMSPTIDYQCGRNTVANECFRTESAGQSADQSADLCSSTNLPVNGNRAYDPRFENKTTQRTTARMAKHASSGYHSPHGGFREVLKGPPVGRV